MIHVPVHRDQHQETVHDLPVQDPPPNLWADLQQLLTELDWFITRDWSQIVSNPLIAKAIIRRATGAALLAEDIRTDLIHTDQSSQNKAPSHIEQTSLRDFLSTTLNGHDPSDTAPQVTAIPMSVDQVILYEFGQPKEHEHPLYVHHHVVNFCAAFYHEDEFVFARAHLQLLLTPTNQLNWLAGPRSIAVDQSHNPLPYTPDGTLFRALGAGITQLIYLHQTELMMKIKQGKRFESTYKLSGSVMPPGMAIAQQAIPATATRQQPAWLNRAH